MSRVGSRAPRYHPACAPQRAAHSEGDDGPIRSVLLSASPQCGWLFFRRLPGDDRIDAVASESSGYRAIANSVVARIGAVASDVNSMSPYENCSASSSTVYASKLRVS